jgi:probable F420-dependent oxidoreductase
VDERRGTPVKIWIALPFFPMKTVPDLVTEAEHLGVEGVTVGDHVCVPAALESRYPYTGKQAYLPIETEFPDPLTWISSLGTMTRTLRFLTHVLLLPLRHPVLVAKEVSTVATMIGSRIDIGVGVGWMKEEFDAMGVPFERRGAIMDEALPLLRKLWSGDAVEHHGEFFDFDPVALQPNPPSRVPLFVGGHGAPALRRAISVDGWLGVNPTLEELAAILGSIRERRRKAGVLDVPFTIRTGIKGRLDSESIKAAAQLGVDGLVVLPHQLVPRGAPVYEMPLDDVLQSVPELVEQAGNA